MTTINDQMLTDGAQPCVADPRMWDATPLLGEANPQSRLRTAARACRHCPLLAACHDWAGTDDGHEAAQWMVVAGRVPPPRGRPRRARPRVRQAPAPEVVGDPCAVDGCRRTVHARQLCSPHYRRWCATGDVQADVPIRGDVPRRDVVAIVDQMLADGEPVTTIAADLAMAVQSIRTAYQRAGQPMPDAVRDAVNAEYRARRTRIRQRAVS